jgi:hypothetical protein
MKKVLSLLVLIAVNGSAQQAAIKVVPGGSLPTLIYPTNYNAPAAYNAYGPLPGIQGIAFDGTTNYYIFDSGVIYKTDITLTNKLLKNTSPFGGLPVVYNHLGDGKYWNGKLYVAMESYHGCGFATNMSIGIYDAATLARLNVVVISNYVTEISAVAIAPDIGTNGTIFTSDFCNGSICKFDLATFAWLGTLPTTFNHIQGMDYLRGQLFLSGNLSGFKGYIASIDPATGSTTLVVSNFPVVGSELEGIVFGPDATSILMMDNQLWAYKLSVAEQIAASPPGYRQLSAQPLASGDMQLSFVGIAGTNYALDWSTSLCPANWMPLATNPAGVNGMLVFTNTPVRATNNFWRIRSVP